MLDKDDLEGVLDELTNIYETIGTPSGLREDGVLEAVKTAYTRALALYEIKMREFSEQELQEKRESSPLWKSINQSAPPPTRSPDVKET